MPKSFNAVALTALLAASLSGCSGGGSYADIDDLQSAIESAGVECDSADGVSDTPDGGRAKTCSDHFVMHMFDSEEDKNASKEFMATIQEGIITTHILEGDDWYVVGSSEERIKDIQGKVGGKATTFTEG